VISRTVPVFVDHGPVPEGLVLGQADVGASTTVSVRGASSLVQRVREAVARVSIDPSAINVDSDVPLIAVDDGNAVVQPVDIEPSSAHVRIQVTRQRSTRTLPVVPVFGGSLPAGYETRVVTLTPPVVTVSGDEPALDTLDTVPTEPIPLQGRTATFSIDAPLDLPEGVSAVDRSKVTVSIEIAPQRASRSFEVGVTLTGARSDRTYRLGSTTVLVTLGGQLSALDAVDPASLTATLDVRSLESGMRDAPVSVPVPAGTTIVSISPGRIAVVVETTGSPSPAYARR
jgi:YbbR domain-containing protein